MLEKLRVGKGDILCLTETPDGFRITPYVEVAEKVMRDDRDVLRALSK